ncbi:MAG TPA: VOC family protein [Candidatus Limnocylindria bacterium]|nr:VOC family protein [Candidatus Limnocylindria bacterium]
MNRQIYITLAVADVSKSAAFFKALGFSLHPQFTGESAACIVISETIFVMLATPSGFVEFSPKPPCDTSKVVEALFAITCESREQVDDLVAKAAAAGGAIHEKSVDYGFMYHGSFADPDGHLWALNYMSPTPPQG